MESLCHYQNYVCGLAGILSYTKFNLRVTKVSGVERVTSKFHFWGLFKQNEESLKCCEWKWFFGCEMGCETNGEITKGELVSNLFCAFLQV